MWRVAVLTVVGLWSESPPQRQRCAEPHYRWSAKIDTTLAAITPQPASIPEMLQSWDAPALRARDGCAPRAARELLAYRVRGWVRRLETSKDDGDWHEPIAVQLVGAAFFDGHHRAGGRRRDAIDPKHGRCNSSLRALWEIHPVYRVEPP